MKSLHKLLLVICILQASFSIAQTKDSLIVAAIIKEATENSQLENLATDLFDGIGPRLVGSPKMQQAHDWALAPASPE